MTDLTYYPLTKFMIQLAITRRRSAVVPLMKAYTQQLTLMGRVIKALGDPRERPGLLVRLRTGDEIEARLMPTSWISAVKDLDLLDHDRFPEADSHLGQPRRDAGDSADSDGSYVLEPKTPAEEDTSDTREPTEAEKKLRQLRARLLSVFSSNASDAGGEAPLVVLEGNYYVNQGKACYEAHRLSWESPASSPSLGTIAGVKSSPSRGSIERHSIRAEGQGLSADQRNRPATPGSSPVRLNGSVLCR